MIAPFLPMLATPAEPFDDVDYSFEVKWDLRQAKPGEGGSDVRKQHGNLLSNPVGSQSHPAELGQQREASLAW
jgi:hypothetical protein